MTGMIPRLALIVFVASQLAGCVNMAVIDQIKITDNNARLIKSTGSPKFVSEKIRAKLAFANLQVNVGVVFDNSGRVLGLSIKKTSGNAEFDALMIEYVTTWGFHSGNCPKQPCQCEIPLRFHFRD